MPLASNICGSHISERKMISVVSRELSFKIVEFSEGGKGAGEKGKVSRAILF